MDNLQTTKINQVNRRHLFYLILFALGFFLLLPHLIGIQRTLEMIRRADPRLILLALSAETLRNILSASSTVLLARMFARRVPLFAMTEAFFASGALNRTFSTGGAPGIILRLLFLTRLGVAGGSVAAIFLIENLAGFLVGGIVFLFGVAALAATQTLDGAAGNFSRIFVSGLLLIILAIIILYRRRALIDRTIFGIALRLNAAAQKFFRHPIVKLSQVRRGLEDFYAGLALARTRPRVFAVIVLINLLRNASGYAALYFSFLALGSPASLPALILFYTAGSVLSSLSAVPGEVLLVGTGMAILSLSFGIPRDLALIAILLSRTVTFWFPLPVGYAALWHLHRQKYL
ncbi:MAG: flippase-like domain-containing protein [Chloroflexi bacterium]|nr:flippase-like domain-containing protein [Chloroflexota bacterium]